MNKWNVCFQRLLDAFLGLDVEFYDDEKERVRDCVDAALSAVTEGAAYRPAFDHAHAEQHLIKAFARNNQRVSEAGLVVEDGDIPEFMASMVINLTKGAGLSLQGLTHIVIPVTLVLSFQVHYAGPLSVPRFGDGVSKDSVEDKAKRMKVVCMMSAREGGFKHTESVFLKRGMMDVLSQKPTFVSEFIFDGMPNKETLAINEAALLNACAQFYATRIEAGLPAATLTPRVH